MRGYHMTSSPFGFCQDGVLEMPKDEYFELIKDQKTKYIMESKVAVKQVIIEQES